jgi:hypothetical protein
MWSDRASGASSAKEQPVFSVECSADRIDMFVEDVLYFFQGCSVTR